jgi:hypothetical protein
MRTARSRISGEKRFDFLFMAPSSQSLEPPQNPGRFTSAELSQLEDAMHVLGMTSAPRTRGRKPAGYRPVQTIQDVKRMMLEGNKH